MVASKVAADATISQSAVPSMGVLVAERELLTSGAGNNSYHSMELSDLILVDLQTQEITPAHGG